MSLHDIHYTQLHTHISLAGNSLSMRFSVRFTRSHDKKKREKSFLPLICHTHKIREWEERDEREWKGWGSNKQNKTEVLGENKRNRNGTTEREGRGEHRRRTQFECAAKTLFNVKTDICAVCKSSTENYYHFLWVTAQHTCGSMHVLCICLRFDCKRDLNIRNSIP